MTKEQQVNQKAALKAQKDSQDAAFKQEARRQALSTASHIERNESADVVLKTADKSYNWLTKNLK